MTVIIFHFDAKKILKIKNNKLPKNFMIKIYKDSILTCQLIQPKIQDMEQGWGRLLSKVIN